MFAGYGTTQMNRHETFLWMLGIVICDLNLDTETKVGALAAVLDPNVKMMIQGDTATPVEIKVKEYVKYLLGRSPVPFWLTKGG